MTTSNEPRGSSTTPVDPDALRAQVRAKYGQVAATPEGPFHFPIGRQATVRCRYDAAIVDPIPDVAVESFAGVANPQELRAIQPGERVVDVGSGAGFDSILAAGATGTTGFVVGVDMTPEMLTKSRATAAELGLSNIEFCEGYAEELPINTGWADVVISNGVFNLCADKRAAFDEVMRVLRPGGVLQFADIATGRPVPEEAVRDIDLWTA